MLFGRPHFLKLKHHNGNLEFRNLASKLEILQLILSLLSLRFPQNFYHLLSLCNFTSFLNFFSFIAIFALILNMSDRVFPSSKPAANGNTANNTTSASANPTPATNKSHLHNPTSRPPYRPPSHRRRTRSGRSICFCFCFWSILILLMLIFLAAIAGVALYILYRPHRPEFCIPSLRIHRLNLTTSADSASSHLSTLLNLTVISKNPNAHLTFFYDSFTLSSFSNDVFLGNGTLPAYSLSKKNETSFRNVVVSGSNDLDAESVNNLRSDLKKKTGGVTLKIQLDTKVKVKMGGLMTKKVGIRVTCDGIKGVVPKGKSPTVTVTTGSKCRVDLRIKIWKWTF